MINVYVINDYKRIQLSKVTVDFGIWIVRINFFQPILKILDVKRVYIEFIAHLFFNVTPFIEHKVDLIVFDKVVESFYSC